VWANRALATNVQASVSVGEPLVVRGRLKVRSELRDGQSWTGADIEASAIGHDLARGTAAFRRMLKGDQASDQVSDQVFHQASGQAPGRASDAPVRPEPSWETEPADHAEGAHGVNGADGVNGAAQQRQEPALVM